MKTTRYRFEQAVQEVKEGTTEWLKDEFKSILESDKDFTRKADYIGFSIANIDVKVASIDEEIKELQQLKKSLKSAKEIVLITGAKVFEEYGIDKIEGAGISSITMSKATTKEKNTLEIINKDELIKLGYFIVSVDEEAVREALSEPTGQQELFSYARIHSEQIKTNAKLKINKRRNVVAKNMEVAS